MVPAEKINDKCDYPEDVRIANLAAAGDVDARRKIACRLLNRVHTTVKYISDRDSDDYTQLSLMEILCAVHTYRGKSSLETWSDRITVRTTLRHLKKIRLREKKLKTNYRSIQMQNLDCSSNPEACDIQSGLLIRHRITQLLQDISPNRRVVIILKLVYGYSIKDISKIISTPVNTVRDRLRIARKQLREKIRSDSMLREYYDLREK